MLAGVCMQFIRDGYCKKVRTPGNLIVFVRQVRMTCRLVTGIQRHCLYQASVGDCFILCTFNTDHFWRDSHSYTQRHTTIARSTIRLRRLILFLYRDQTHTSRQARMVCMAHARTLVPACMDSSVMPQRFGSIRVLYRLIRKLYL